MYIRRELENRIRQYLDKQEIIAVLGPRQSGKTTLLKEIASPLKNVVFVDFEDRSMLEMFNNDIKTFYNLHARNADYLFIDEFQYAKEGGQKLKYLYDAYRLKMIISGSSALDLTHQAVKYLVGRIFMFDLFPLNFNEFISYRNPSLHENIYLGIKRNIDGYLTGRKKKPPVISAEALKTVSRYYYEYLVFGGYPRVVTARNNDEKITVLKNIYNTYFLREIRDILQLSSEDEMQKLIKALALQTGSTVAYNELGQTASLNYAALMKHLNILEKTFVIRKIRPFYHNKRTEIAKSPKVYFLDCGFRNTIIDNFQAPDKRTDRGSLNENFVAGELLKAGCNINFWRSKSNAEVDFVLERNNVTMAIEVKSSLHQSTIGKALLSFDEKFAPQRKIIASENYSGFDKKRNVFFMPLFFI